MSIVDATRVGTTTWAWSSCRFTIDGQPTEGIVAIDYEDKLETRVVSSNIQDGPPLGRSVGRYQIGTFPLRFLRDSAVALKTYLLTQAAPLSASYGQAVFTLSLQLSGLDSPDSIPTTIVFGSCRILGEKSAHEEGVDAAVTEFTIGCLLITQDGINLWNALPPLPGLAFPGADTITLGGVQAPGKWTLESADKEYGWQIRQATAMTGATVVPIGDPLVEPEFLVEFWDPVDYQAFRLFRSSYLKKPLVGVPGSPTSLALGIDYPELKEMGVTAVVLKKITPLIADSYGVWSCKVRFLQYRKPKPALSKPKASIPDNTPAVPTAQTAEEQELAAKLAQLKALAP